MIEPPHLYDAGFEDLVKRGEAHEKEILRGFRERGLQVVEITADRRNVDAGADATVAAPSSDVDVICQAALTREAAGGQPALLDFPDLKTGR